MSKVASKWGETTRNLVHKAFFTMHPAPLCRPNTLVHGPKLTDRWDNVTCSRCLAMRKRTANNDNTDRNPDVYERIMARRKGLKPGKIQK